MRRPVVAVTGATGFLGRRLVPALIQAGWDVRALVRAAPAQGLWGDEGPTLIAGDLGDTPALRRLTVDAQVVIHAAGLIKAPRRSDFFDVNADGVRRVVEAAPPSSRIVLISSLAAREPQLSDYAASKRAGEATVSELAAGRSSIVRPPAIYGPGDRETLALFRLAATSPVLPLLGGPAARLVLAHVDDVVDAIVHLASLDAGPAKLVVTGDRPEGYAWREILCAAAAAVGGARAALIPVPSGVVTALGVASEFVGVATGRSAIFTRGKAREILHPDWSVPEAERFAAGPPARFTLAAGFVQTVRWYRANGWLATPV